MVGLCEHDYEISFSIKGGKCFASLNDSFLFSIRILLRGVKPLTCLRKQKEYHTKPNIRLQAFYKILSMPYTNIQKFYLVHIFL